MDQKYNTHYTFITHAHKLTNTLHTHLETYKCVDLNLLIYCAASPITTEARFSIMNRNNNKPNKWDPT